jgi:hypothetical protein
MIEITSPPSSGDVKLLGSGAGSLAAGASVVNVGSFTLPAMTLEQKLLMTINAIGATALITPVFSFSILSNNIDSADVCYSAGIVQHEIRQTWVFRSPANANNIDTIIEGTGIFQVQPDLSSLGTMTSAKKVYCNIQQNDAAINFSWSAFIFGSGVK